MCVCVFFSVFLLSLLLSLWRFVELLRFCQFLEVCLRVLLGRVCRLGFELFFV